MTHTFKLARRIARLRAGGLAAGFMFAAACNSDTTSETESLPQTESVVDNAVADGSDALPVEGAAFSMSSRRRGVPFGFWRLEYNQLSEQYTSLKKTGTPKSIRRDLEIARSRGARVFVQLAGSHRNYMTGGRFDLGKFKRLLSQYRGVNLNSYIADGTLAGHILIDEPNDPSNWGGKPIPYATLEAVAAYSKLLWPNLPTLMRAKPSWLARAPFRWKHLDGGWAQYAARLGDIDRYRDNEARAAKSANLKVAWGLNVMDGGNGSSRVRGTKPGRYNMTATEVRKYGRSLLAAPVSCAFLMWRFDHTYLGRSGVQSAMRELRGVAGNKATATCAR